MESFGTILRAEREARGWTQQYLSDTSNVSTTTISRIEHGKIIPHRWTVRAIESALGMAYGTLMTEPPVAMPSNTTDDSTIAAHARAFIVAQRRMEVNYSADNQAARTRALRKLDEACG